ncbi:MAG: hypothetical protein H6834_08690 [Planctomycetes bacterium]|nr:hypothetical protein [Planctomycetota bacterium]
MLRRLLLLAPLTLANPSANAAIPSDLEMLGGIIGETTTVDIGGNPGTFYLLLFSSNEGPLPLALVDPTDPRSLQVGGDLLGLGVFLSGPAPAQLQVPIPTDASLVGRMIFTQVVTAPGPTSFFDEISNPSALYLTARNTTVPSPFPLPAAKAAATSSPLTNGDCLVAGGTQIVDLGPFGETTAFVFEKDRRKIVPTANTMHVGHVFHTATVLQDGRVFVAGGADATGAVTNATDIYDPATRTFSPGPNLRDARAVHTAVRLADGRVFLAGGTNTFTPTNDVLQLLGGARRTAEIFDPVTGQTTSVRNLPVARAAHSMTLLPSGEVLIHGGVAVNFILTIPIPSFPTQSLIYDPATDTYRTSGTATNPRAWHTAHTLANGQIVAVGGFEGDFVSLALPPVWTVERFDPTTEQWTAMPDMIFERVQTTVWEQPDGSFLVVGGATGQANGPTPDIHVERWNPVTNQFDFVRNLGVARGWHAFHFLPDGHLVLMGGIDGLQSAIADVEFFTF